MSTYPRNHEEYAERQRINRLKGAQAHGEVIEQVARAETRRRLEAQALAALRAVPGAVPEVVLRQLAAAYADGALGAADAR